MTYIPPEFATLMREFETFDFGRVYRDIFDGSRYWQKPWDLLTNSPDFHDIYLHGRDDRFNAVFDMCTDHQRETICTFLSDRNARGYRGVDFRAIQTLYWNWRLTGFQHPAIEASRQFLERMWNYTYPPATDFENGNEIQSILRAIEEAFDDVPYPPSGEIIEDGLEDPEFAEYAVTLRDVPWQRIHPFLLSVLEGALTVASDAGFRYLLPAFLRQDLYLFAGQETDRELELWTNGDPVFNLTYDFSEHRGKGSTEPNGKMRYIQKMAEFTHEERKAIIAYIKFYLDRMPDYILTSKLRNVLDNYWIPSLG